jgi:hypothetical protein
MTPMAGGISNGKKNRFVFFLGLLKSLLSPRIPIHRIVGVL